MNRITLFTAVLCMSVSTYADEWVKPSAPASTQFEIIKECYLYNRDAEGFLTGGNEYGTRASISPTKGHKIYIQIYETENNGLVNWDGYSYYITNYVESGGMKDQIGYMFMDNPEAIYVDNTKDGKANNRYIFELQLDNTYKIGLSASNAEMNPETYPDTYLGLIPEKNDTRIYAIDPDTYSAEQGYNPENYQTSWYFVSPETYEKYVADLKQYNAAMSLKTLLSEADTIKEITPEVIEAAHAIYNNYGSTKEELDSTYNALQKIIYEIRINSASTGNPVEILAELGTVEQTFTSGNTTGWTMATAASNKQANNGNNAADYSITGNHLENWSSGAFGTGRIYAKLSDIPNGVYRFSALAFANVTGGTYLYAGNNKKTVESTQIDAEKVTEVTTIVTDGELEFGLRVETSGPNWIGIDNVCLYYLGASEDSYTLIAEEKISQNKDYESLIAENEIMYYNNQDYLNYVSAKDSLQKSVTAENITANLAIFEAAVETLEKSIEAYSEYHKIVTEASEWINKATTETEEVNTLSDYLQEETNEGYNGNGSAIAILTGGILTADDISAEKSYLEKLYNDAMASGMNDGDDCTELLKNAKFSETGGWISAVGPEWPAGNTEVFPVLEAKNMVCDVYQNLTGLQNGVYEINLQAVLRPGDTYTEENEQMSQAYVYVNSFEKKIPCGDVASANDASDAFAENKYPVKVYGLVTDGVLKTGITNKVRSVENCVLWAGGVSVTFRGKNEEALAEMITEELQSATALLDNYCGSTELETLEYYITYATEEEDLYETLINMKKAKDDVIECTELYENISKTLETLDEVISTSNADKKLKKAATNLVMNTSMYWNSQELTITQAKEALESINETIVMLKLANIQSQEGTEENPVDFSELIVNRTFDPEKGDKNTGVIEGWTTTAMNGYKQNTVSYNKVGFELNQKINGLKKGNYTLKVYTYYRAGYWNDEEARIANGEETHLTTMYASTADSLYSVPVMNLTEGAVTDKSFTENNTYTLSDGKYAPDGTTPTVDFFNAGYYLNTLDFKMLENGDVTIGLSKKESYANDYEVVGAWELWYKGLDEVIPETIQDTTDMTALIVNPTFDPAKGDKSKTYIEGWVTSAMNGYKQNTVSYNKAKIDLSQKISGLPKGTYKVTVYTYYRAGYWNDEEARVANGEETHLTALYAATSDSTYSIPVKNLREDASISPDITSGNTYTLSSGMYAPDGTTPTVDYFNAGYYLNELPFYVSDGTVTIGLRKTEILPNDYEVVGAWKLYYYGKGNYLEEIHAAGIESATDDMEESVPTEYYNISGSRINGPQKGINIVRMSNNSVIKVLVK